MSTVKKGDLILIDYTARIEETGEVFDTSLEGVAKKEGIYREGTPYEPMLVAVGERWVVSGLDEGLVGMKAKEKRTIKVPPEMGVGSRDPSKVRLFPLRFFREVPRPGQRVEVRGMVGTVLTVGGGRVQVDFNPPLAGKTLVYEVTVRKVLRTKAEKVRALIHRRIPQVRIDEVGVVLTKDSVKIELPEGALQLEGLQLAKRGIARDLFRFLLGIGEVIFVERYKKAEEVRA